MTEEIIVIGPGKSSLDYGPNANDKVLAFQEVFPNCIEHLSLTPDYWTSGDPNAYVLGFQYLLDNTNNPDLKKIKILVPDSFFGDLPTYRKSFGTTPLMRIDRGWEKFTNLLREVSKEYKVVRIPVVTTKYLALHQKAKTELDSVFEQEYIRFMLDKVVFGTIPFDSESVIGDTFKWGLENKLTSNVLPICYYLKSKKVKIYGFDYQGPRFYSEIARHPWNDESQIKDNIVEFSLNILKKWVEWKSIHGMEIVSGTQDPVSLPNNFLTFEE